MTKEKEKFGLEPEVKVTDKPEVEQYDYCFNLVTDKNGTRVAVGNTVVSATVFANKEAAKAYIDQKPWALIVAAVDVCQQLIHSKNK